MSETRTLSTRVLELDGLRGIAILLVLGSHLIEVGRGHAGFNWIDRAIGMATGMGWLGVDIFFVLSGYLITGILWDNRGTKFYFRNFYARRLLRIFPLYYLFLFTVFFCLPRFRLSIGAFGEAPREPMWPYWLYVSNFTMAITHVVTPLLAITWSLSIEEQFYSVWPAVVSRFSLRSLMKISLALYFTSFLLRLVFLFYSSHLKISTYFLTFTRMDGLGIGAWIALSARRPNGAAINQAFAKWAGMSGLIVLMGCVVFSQMKHQSMRENPSSVLIYSAAAVAFGSLLIYVTTHDCRILRSHILLVYGRYSYAIYLLHEPVKILVRQRLHPNFLGHIFGSLFVSQLCYALVVTVAVTILAALSWRFLESRLISLNRFFPVRKDAVKDPSSPYHGGEGVAPCPAAT
jgi:peptidoglycan/LPS O-acetylase OafA/YrhL